MRVPRAAAIFAVILIASTVWMLVLLTGSTSDPGIGRMPLLAVSVDDEGNEGAGGVAYLDLRIVNGTGNVYIHSEPLTKVDTQASTTFAQRYACDQANVNCDRYDFLYSIESDAPIVGGPSAGAATAALTYAVLTNQHVPQDVAVTGTISSGGVIGTVGGIPQKLDAAAEKGLDRVIIPYLSEENATENATIDAYRARTLDEVIGALGLQAPRSTNATIEVPEAYTETMREVALDLCEQQERPDVDADLQSVELAYERIENLTIDAIEAAEREAYYTQASYCFNMRVQHYYLELVDETRTLNYGEARTYVTEAIEDNLSRARSVFETFSSELDDFDLNEIQIYSIVEERLRESEEIGESIIDEIERNTNMSEARDRFDQDTLYSTGYMLARIDSMQSWTRFAGFEQGAEIERSSLKRACSKKLSEASEQAEYTAYLTGVNALEISEVYDAYERGDFAACIYQASLITARAETFLSTIGIDEDEFPLLYEAKSRAAYQAIADQTRSAAFPVMAYSYYEYAQSLKDSNEQTALLYIENALELAELDLYFEATDRSPIDLDADDTLAFAFGVFLTSGFGLIITAGGPNTRSKRKK